MKISKRILIILNCFFVLNFNAQKIIDTIAVKAGVYDIPIKIKLPKNTIGKSPVYFFVHGGGWNGGDQKEVPPATISGDANFLVDYLGVIYVGLAYRCKGNNATFADAINDLEASVKWFMDNSEMFNADVTRIGFGGSSAGSTLAAIMAQKYQNSRLFVGLEGMYNLVDHDPEKSSFPNKEGRELYGLSTKKQSKRASAFYNLRKKPPTTLLFNGKEDALCHFSQTENFANKIKTSGGKVKIILYENINHTCLNASYPEVMKKSVLEIAILFIEEFQLKNTDLNAIESLLNQKLHGMTKKNTINQVDILGSWKLNNITINFYEDGKGTLVNSKNNTIKEFLFSLELGTILCDFNGETRSFFMRENNKMIYEINLVNRDLKYRAFNYTKT